MVHVKVSIIYVYISFSYVTIWSEHGNIYCLYLHGVGANK